MVIDTSPYKVEGSYMADYAFLYVPDACRQKEPCPLHIFFHGSEQSAVMDEFGTDVLRDTGLLEFAANPDLSFIVLAPQVNDPDSAEDFNFIHFWRSSWYSDREHPQIQELRAIVGALFGKDLFTARYHVVSDDPADPANS